MPRRNAIYVECPPQRQITLITQIVLVHMKIISYRLREVLRRVRRVCLVRGGSRVQG